MPISKTFSNIFYRMGTKDYVTFLIFKIRPDLVKLLKVFALHFNFSEINLLHFIFINALEVKAKWGETYKKDDAKLILEVILYF